MSGDFSRRPRRACGATSSTRSRTRRCWSRRSSSRWSSSSPSRAACRASATSRASTSRRATRRSSSCSSSCSRPRSAACSPASRPRRDFESGFARRLLLGAAAARGHHRRLRARGACARWFVHRDDRHGRRADRRHARRRQRVELVGARRRSRCWSTCVDALGRRAGVPLQDAAGRPADADPGLPDAVPRAGLRAARPARPAGSTTSPPTTRSPRCSRRAAGSSPARPTRSRSPLAGVGLVALGLF